MRMTIKPVNPFGRRGVIKAYRNKSYGFITDIDSKCDVYVHSSHIINGRVNKTGKQYFDIGDVVEFDIVEDRTGLHASNVTLVMKKEEC